MEMMPFSAAALREPLISIPASAPAHYAGWPKWRSIVPTLIHRTTRLRELRSSDALPLLSMLTTEEVTRFISPPPVTQEGFEKFIEWTHRKRVAGQYVCFGIVPAGYDVAVGIFQIQIPSGTTPEWGFAMGSPFWGTGLFVQGAEAVLDFAFHGIGLEELCARAAIENRRGNAALQKVGAVRESIIRDGLVRNGKAMDQYYWTLSADGRPRRKIIWEGPAH
ncbi:MAG TPA: GNAT family N-acetyltransferase [Vicinamibacterales bacterium]